LPDDARERFCLAFSLPCTCALLTIRSHLICLDRCLWTQMGVYLLSFAELRILPRESAAGMARDVSAGLIRQHLTRAPATAACRRSGYGCGGGRTAGAGDRGRGECGASAGCSRSLSTRGPSTLSSGCGTWLPWTGPWPPWRSRRERPPPPCQYHLSHPLSFAAGLALSPAPWMPWNSAAG
jgi:hypothetical protein